MVNMRQSCTKFENEMTVVLLVHSFCPSHSGSRHRSKNKQFLQATEQKQKKEGKKQ